MYGNLEQRLNIIATEQLAPYLKAARTGLEKESLRVTPDGSMSPLPHPISLGSALTHPWITTDYSESLLELITPPEQTASAALDFLLDIETFVYKQLKNDLLWTTSMPCVLGGEEDIHIAEYGHSNVGLMKHVYRQGLAWRYGKTMQVIAGIHFNYSFSEDFWPVWHQREGPQQNLQAFRNQHYMNVTRNLQHYGWLILYLFGSSPAICKSFLNDRQAPVTMRELNNGTLYEPYGTSLRMGNIGYTNSQSQESGMQVHYNSLDSYVDSLRAAINHPVAAYEKIGVKVEGVYRQLNSNLLQIENEYYSTVRPKQPLQGLEKPTDALQARGIEYVELRSVDINAFHPAGITRRQLRFLEIFMHFSLLQDSPLIDLAERKNIDQNQLKVAHHGREPGLKLDWQGKSRTLSSWALEILDAMQGVAELLDHAHANTTSGANQVQETHTYQDTLAQQRELVLNPDITPSAHMLEDMKNHQDESFFEFAQRKSEEHRAFFLERYLSDTREQQLKNMAKESLQQQEAIEARDTIDFDTFLANYFAQTH